MSHINSITMFNFETTVNSVFLLKFVVDDCLKTSSHILFACFYVNWIRYEASSRYKKMRYEEEFLRYLQNIMADVDRRIRRGHARLNLSRAEEEKVSSIVYCNQKSPSCWVCDGHKLKIQWTRHKAYMPFIWTQLTLCNLQGKPIFRLQASCNSYVLIQILFSSVPKIWFIGNFCLKFFRKFHSTVRQVLNRWIL